MTSSGVPPRRDHTLEQLFTLAGLDVIAHEAQASPDHVSTLLPGEDAGTEAMVESRLAEYATARACARSGLVELGLVAPISRTESGAPEWPHGVTGSITHTRGHCAAICSTTADAVIGVDIEIVDRLTRALAKRILTESEQAALGGLTADEAQWRLAATFAVKEAFYKAHHQLDARYLGFGVIEVCDFRDGPEGFTQVQLAATGTGVDPAIVQRTSANVARRGTEVVAGVVIRR